MKFHHVAVPGYPQPVGRDGKPAQNQGVATTLPGAFVVGVLMKKLALHRAQVVAPLPFNVDKRPLPAAEGKVLQP